MNGPSVGAASAVSPAAIMQPRPGSAAVLVTGGAQRLGLSIVRDLAAHGWTVVIHYNHSEDQAAAARDEICAEGGKAVAVQADLSCGVEAANLVRRASDLVGPIGVLINNASLFERDDIQSASTEVWRRQLDVNVQAPFLLSQTFAEHLGPAATGAIINMVDSRVLNLTRKHFSYTISKSALWTMTQTLAQAFAPRIRVNGVAPGPTLPWNGQSDADFKARCRRLPLQRPATAQEVAETVRFLISVTSVTGQLVALDGGDHLARQETTAGIDLSH